MKQMVMQGETLLEQGSLDDFGRLLNESWQLKKTLASDISNYAIDEIYRKALKSGALGGKILGAGGGGFLLLYVPKHLQEQVKRNLHELECVAFRFEEEGTHLLG